MLPPYHWGLSLPFVVANVSAKVSSSCVLPGSSSCMTGRSLPSFLVFVGGHDYDSPSTSSLLPPEFLLLPSSFERMKPSVVFCVSSVASSSSSFLLKVNDAFCFYFVCSTLHVPFFYPTVRRVPYAYLAPPPSLAPSSGLMGLLCLPSCSCSFIYFLMSIAYGVFFNV